MEDPAEEAQSKTTKQEPAMAVGVQFFWEISIFLTGLFVGFFWYMFISYSPNTADAHIIIGLLVIIICLARYVFLLRQHHHQHQNHQRDQ